MNLDLLIKYLKRRLKLIFVFVLFTIIFILTFFLYQIPTEAVWYAATLCAVIGILILIKDYINLSKKHGILQKLKSCIMFTKDELPYPKDVIEKDYNELIHILFHDKSKLATDFENKQMELIDYYSLWVHQIKTPIAALRLLIQTEDSIDHADLLAELFKIEEYVEMVLQYLRMENMSTDLLLKKYSLDGIVKQAIRKYASIFIRKKIRLDYDELNSEILTDEKWLVFVMEQLLSNALKYTSESGTISIYMHKKLPKTLVIQDTGIGIREEDIQRVFEKGFTGFNGRFDKKSTGIGLYLCKRILNKLSHTIVIESEVDKGTKVTINLDTIDRVIE